MIDEEYVKKLEELNRNLEEKNTELSTKSALADEEVLQTHMLFLGTLCFLKIAERGRIEDRHRLKNGPIAIDQVNIELEAAMEKNCSFLLSKKEKNFSEKESIRKMADYVEMMQKRMENGTLKHA